MGLLASIFAEIQSYRSNKFEWKNNRSVEKLPNKLTRSLASQIYETYDRDVYWLDFIQKLEKTLPEKFDKEEFKLSTFSFIKGRPAIDKDGESVGKIVDFCINPANGEIIYCVMASDKSELRAIPLGAFVRQKPYYRWTIELPKESILKFDTFQKNSPPVRVDRGWSEYVAVRYGREGLQSQKKAAK